MIGELSSLLLGRKSVEAPVASGEPFAVPLPASAGPAAGLSIVAAITTPGDHAALAEEPEGLVFRARAAGPPGVTRIEREGRSVFALATIVPDQESDLATLPASVFRDRLSGTRRISFRDSSQSDDENDVAWVWLAVACVACLAAELITLRAFRA
jgi:hypothetical protein